MPILEFKIQNSKLKISIYVQSYFIRPSWIWKRHTVCRALLKNIILFIFPQGIFSGREIKNQSPLGIKVQGIIEKGNWCLMNCWSISFRSALQQAGAPAGFVFDGFPRTISQADDLDKLLKETGESVSLVLALDVDEEEVVTRLLKRAQRKAERMIPKK